MWIPIASFLEKSLGLNEIVSSLIKESSSAGCPIKYNKPRLILHRLIVSCSVTPTHLRREDNLMMYPFAGR
jgi:hypothetical protein